MGVKVRKKEGFNMYLNKKNLLKNYNFLTNLREKENYLFTSFSYRYRFILNKIIKDNLGGIYLRPFRHDLGFFDYGLYTSSGLLLHVYYDMFFGKYWCVHDSGLKSFVHSKFSFYGYEYTVTQFMHIYTLFTKINVFSTGSLPHKAHVLRMNMDLSFKLNYFYFFGNYMKSILNNNKYMISYMISAGIKRLDDVLITTYYNKLMIYWLYTFNNDINFKHIFFSQPNLYLMSTQKQVLIQDKLNKNAAGVVY